MLVGDVVPAVDRSSVAAATSQTSKIASEMHGMLVEHGLTVSTIEHRCCGDNDRSKIVRSRLDEQLSLKASKAETRISKPSIDDEQGGSNGPVCCNRSSCRQITEWLTSHFGRILQLSSASQILDLGKNGVMFEANECTEEAIVVTTV
jgi:hypothetical protein